MLYKKTDLTQNRYAIIQYKDCNKNEFFNHAKV